MDKLKDAVISKRVAQLINEVAVGEHTIDVLSNTSLALSDERQVEYFSHARENMKKDVAYIIIRRVNIIWKVMNIIIINI